MILSHHARALQLFGFPFVFPVALPRRWVEVLEPAFPPNARARWRKGGEAGPRTSTRFPEIQCQLSAGNHNGVLTGK